VALYSSASRYSSRLSRPTRRATAPFAQAAQEEYTEDKEALRPVEVVLDLLSRGQYASANFVQEMLTGEGLNKALQGAWQGVTGERKGDFEDVLFGSEGRRGLLGDVEEEDRTFWQKAAGFAANVLLDPTTYIGLGPTKAARAAAKVFADDAVVAARGAIKNYDEVAEKLLQSGRNIGEVARKGPEKAARALKAAGAPGNPYDVARQMDEVWRDSYQKGLRMTREEMVASMRKPLQEEQDLLAKTVAETEPMPYTETDDWLQQVDSKTYLDDLEKKIEGNPGMYTGVAPGRHGLVGAHWGLSPESATDFLRRFNRAKTLRQRITELDTPELTKELDRAGERSFRMLSREFGKGSEWARRADLFRPRIDWIRKAVKAAPGGQRLTDAWWAVSNRGPIGAVRRVFGFRNAYQRLINQSYMKGVDRQTQVFAENQIFINRHWKKLNPDDRRGFVQAMAQAEARGISPTEMAERVDILTPLGGDTDRVVAMLRANDEMATRWRKAFEDADSAEIREHGTIEAYFPILRKKEYAGDVVGPDISTRTAGFTLGRGEPLAAHLEAQENKLMALFPGIDKGMAKDLVSKHNVSDIVTDPLAAFELRAHVQSKMEARILMIREFKEFGINVNEVEDVLRPALPGERGAMGVTEIIDTDTFNQRNFLQALKTGGAQRLNLHTADDAAFEGYLFDREVVSVINNISKATLNEQSMRLIRKGVDSVNNSFKSVATASGGFHARNFMGVVMQGFLKFGHRWFTGGVKGGWGRAIIATEAALGGWDSPVLKTLEARIGKARYQDLLSSRVGGYQLREYPDLLLRNGIVSPTSRISSPEDVAQFNKTTNWLKVWQPDNPILRGSKAFGARTDSYGRTHAFFLDLEDITKGQAGFASDSQIEWAKLEAKKWFYDYNDLTEAEKTYMRGMMPFYTWLRKNTVQQVLGIMENPDMYAVIPKIQEAVEARGTAAEDRSLMPDWWLESGMFPVKAPFFLRDRVSENETVVFRPNFPYQEGLSLLPIVGDEDSFSGIRPNFADWFDSMVNSLNPVLKTVIEVTTGTNTFFKEELPTHSKAPRSLRLLTKSPKVLAFLDWGVGLVNDGKGLGFTLDDGSVNTDDRGRLMMNSKWERLLDNNLPILDRLGQWLDLPIAALEGLGVHVEKAVTEATGAKDDYDALDEFLRILSQSFGLKYAVLQEDEQRLQRAYDMYDIMQERLREREPDERRSLMAAEGRQRQFSRLGFL
jgi:hypothetical protein